MSLKAIHLIFITSSVLLSFGFAGWAFQNYREDHQRLDLAYAIGSLVLAVALMAYGRYFLRKLKNVSYL